MSQRPAREPSTDPAPQNPIISPNPADPASNRSVNGTSATIAIPIPRTRTIHATESLRRTGSRTRNRKPAQIPWCSPASDRSPAKSARTETTSIAESTNDAALIANTHGAPTTASRIPPIAGPTMMPTLRPIATRLLAQLTWSCGTRFGIAALEAGQNGASASADRNAISTSGPGDSATNAMPAKQAAAARSDTIITVRRSNRSPSTLANGPTAPLTPSVTSSAAASHTAEPVWS